MRSSLCFTAAAAALAFGISSASAQTILMEENFDDIDDIAGLLAKPMWNFEDDPGMSISDEQSLSGDQALRHDAVATGQVRGDLGDGYQANDEGVGDGAIMYSGWQYLDNDGQQTADSTLVTTAWADNAWGEGALDDLIAHGVYGLGPAVTTHYATRALSGDNWVGVPENAEAAERIGEEWVHLAIFLQSDSVEFYVNGALIRTDDTNVAAEWDSFRIGSNTGSAPSDTVIFWDDVEYVIGASAPEPVSVPEWHLY